MCNIEWLETWYARNCDGSWEHSYGIKIETLDNPGWYVKIDLNETDYANLNPEEIIRDMGDNNWMHCSITDGIFKGYGDSMKLNQIIETFKKWMDH